MRQALVLSPIESTFERDSERSSAKFDLFWKETLVEGVWKHPIKGFTLNIDKERLQKLAANFKKQSELSIDVPVPSGHSYNERANNGFVRDVRVRQREDGKWVCDSLIEVTDKDANTRIKDGTTKRVSVSINPNLKHADGEGNVVELGECFEHVALTSYPVMTSLGDFVAFDKTEEVVAVTHLDLVDDVVPSGGEDGFLLDGKQLQEFAQEIADKTLAAASLIKQKPDNSTGRTSMSTITPEQLRTLEQKFGFEKEELTEENWLGKVDEVDLTPKPVEDPKPFDVTMDPGFQKLSQQNQVLILDRNKHRHADVVRRLKAAQAENRIDKAAFDLIIGSEEKLQFSTESGFGDDFELWISAVEAKLDVVEVLPKPVQQLEGRITSPFTSDLASQDTDEAKKMEKEIDEAVASAVPQYSKENIQMDPITGLFGAKA